MDACVPFTGLGVWFVQASTTALQEIALLQCVLVCMLADRAAAVCACVCMLADRAAAVCTCVCMLADRAAASDAGCPPLVLLPAHTAVPQQRVCQPRCQ
eukprot:1157363-Pelagomonas_calceolata.AAC.7